MKLIRLVGLLLAAAVLASPAEAQKPKFPVNGGFETPDPDVPGYPYGWFATILPDYADYVTFESDGTVRHGGLQSVLISIHDDHPADLVNYNWGQQVEHLSPGRTYRLSGFVRTENVRTTPSLFVGCYNADGQILGGASTEPNARNHVVGTTDWTRVKRTFTVPAGTTTVVLRAILPTTDNNGARVWFDDIKIKPL